MTPSIIVLHYGIGKPEDGERYERVDGLRLHESICDALREHETSDTCVGLQAEFDTECVYGEPDRGDLRAMFLHQSNDRGETRTADYYKRFRSQNPGVPVVVVSNGSSSPSWLSKTDRFLSIEGRDYRTAVPVLIRQWKGDQFSRDAFADAFDYATNRDLEAIDTAVDELACLDLVMSAFLAVHSDDEGYSDWHIVSGHHLSKLSPNEVNWAGHSGLDHSNWFNDLWEQLKENDRSAFQKQTRREIERAIRRRESAISTSEFNEIRATLLDKSQDSAKQFAKAITEAEEAVPFGLCGSLRLVCELLDQNGVAYGFKVSDVSTASLCLLFQRAHLEFVRVTTLISRCIESSAVATKDKRWFLKLRHDTNHDDLKNAFLINLGYTEGDADDTRSFLQDIWNRLRDADESQTLPNCVELALSNWPDVERRIRYLILEAPSECNLDGTDEFCKLQQDIIGDDGILATLQRFVLQFMELTKQRVQNQHEQLRIFWDAADRLRVAISDIEQRFDDYFTIKSASKP